MIAAAPVRRAWLADHRRDAALDRGDRRGDHRSLQGASVEVHRAGMSARASIWIGAPPVLASKSAGRRRLLEAAGIPVEVLPAAIDERAIEQDFLSSGGQPTGVAAALARAKAIGVSARRPGALCIGADQTLTLHGEALHQAPTLAQARAQLSRLAGHTHTLTSAACVARDGKSLFEAADNAALTMRPLDDDAIARYFDIAGPDVLQSVGGYQIEGLGVHLFEKIAGDHATIVGLPLLPLLAWLRGAGFVRL
jgi:septum formation protein